MFTATLFTIAKMWKQPTCPSTDKWVKKIQYMQMIEHYSVFKKKETLSYVTLWMKLEDVMLSEMSQLQKNK